MGKRYLERQLIAKDKLLGKVSDSHERWARLYDGVSRTVVSSVRQNLNIPPHKPMSHLLHPMRKYIVVDPLLGKVADRLLARKYDCSRHLVMQVRKRLGIKPANIAGRTELDVDFIPSWHSELLLKWGRPRGMDKHLEALSE